MTPIHFAAKELLNPANPVTVNLIGAGGTGSQMLTALARMNHSLVALGHPGLHIVLYDDDDVTEANFGRQLFADAELHLNKSVALISRVNRFFGTNWKAVAEKFTLQKVKTFPQSGKANIYISCVDSVATRFEIETVITTILQQSASWKRDRPLYWMDCGNSRQTGQVVLSTVGAVAQPESKKYEPIGVLPMVTAEFKDLLEAEKDNQEPSCSLAEALEKQDLFINSTLANMGASLLWNLFREGLTVYRGFFLNLKDFRTQPIPVG